MLTVYPIRLRFISARLLASAPHICKSALFKSYFFWILLSLCLWRTDVPPPRFPLVSFCRCCFLPAVFLRFRSKNRIGFTVVHGWTWFHAATSLTFRQTRYQALYKDVQRLIEDIAVRRIFSIYIYASPHAAVTGYEGRDLINNPDAEHRGTVLNVSYCVFYKVVAVGFDTLYYGEKRRGTKHSA